MSITPLSVVNQLTATATADITENNAVIVEKTEVSQDDKQAERSEEKSGTGRYDLIVDGTGLTASIVACAASRSGKTVLHIDSNDYYGCDSASFPLEDFLTWCREATSQDNVHAVRKEEKVVCEEVTSPVAKTESKSANHVIKNPIKNSDKADLDILLNPTPSFARIIQFHDLGE